MNIFMIGTQRSGSNLLRLMLNEPARIAAPHPPHILQRLMPLVPNYGDLEKRENFRQIESEFEGPPSFMSTDDGTQQHTAKDNDHAGREFLVVQKKKGDYTGSNPDDDADGNSKKLLDAQVRFNQVMQFLKFRITQDKFDALSHQQCTGSELDAPDNRLRSISANKGYDVNCADQ